MFGAAGLHRVSGSGYSSAPHVETMAPHLGQTDQRLRQWVRVYVCFLCTFVREQ